MSEARVNNLSNESNTGGPSITGITTFSGTNFFVPPVGNTQQRPENPQKGSIRFNTDTKHLEYFKGNTIGWSEVEASHGQLGGGGGSNDGVGARGLLGGGDTPTILALINMITLSTMGNAADFGDLTSPRSSGGCISNRKTIAWGGGYSPGVGNSIETCIFSSLGNSVDNKDLTASLKGVIGGSGNNYRGIFAGGATHPSSTQQNTIQYYTFDADADCVDFGDLVSACYTGSACASSTRSLISLGVVGPARSNRIEQITTATTGNALDFGDLTITRNGTGALSSATRGVWGGGEDPAKNNIIDYVTIASKGNAIDFGDMLYIRSNAAQDGLASPTRGLFSGGGSPATGHDGNRMNVIQKIEIATTGNAIDFGDLVDHTSNFGAMSNAHGGL